MNKLPVMKKPFRPLTIGAFCCTLPLLFALQGCAVVAVASTAVSVTAGAVGLAADAAIGTVKIVGKGVGKAADAMLDDESQNDGSGVQIKYRDRDRDSEAVPAQNTLPDSSTNTSYQ